MRMQSRRVKASVTKAIQGSKSRKSRPGPLISVHGPSQKKPSPLLVARWYSGTSHVWPNPTLREGQTEHVDTSTRTLDSQARSYNVKQSFTEPFSGTALEKREVPGTLSNRKAMQLIDASVESSPFKGLLEFFKSPNTFYNIHWDHWDGKPWELASVYRTSSKFFGTTSHYNKLANQHRAHLTSTGNQYLKCNEFLARYYNQSSQVQRSMYALRRIHGHLGVISFLLKGAVLRLSGHSGFQKIAQATGKLENYNYMIQQELFGLEDIRQIQSARAYSPLTMAYSVQKWKLSHVYRASAFAFRTRMKESRRLIKAETGDGFRLGTCSDEDLRKTTNSFNEWKLANQGGQRLQELVDTNPWFWPVESISNAIQAGLILLGIYVHEMKSILDPLYYHNSIPAYVYKLRRRAWERMMRPTGRLLLNIEEIRLLRRDWSALSLHHAVTKSEPMSAEVIETSRTFYLARQEARSREIPLPRLYVNNKLKIDWCSWNGRPWDPAQVEKYHHRKLKEICDLLFQWRLAQDRLVNDTKSFSAVDHFLTRYYKDTWQALATTVSYRRPCTNIHVADYLLLLLALKYPNHQTFKRMESLALQNMRAYHQLVSDLTRLEELRIAAASGRSNPSILKHEWQILKASSKFRDSKSFRVRTSLLQGGDDPRGRLSPLEVEADGPMYQAQLLADKKRSSIARLSFDRTLVALNDAQINVWPAESLHRCITNLSSRLLRELVIVEYMIKPLRKFGAPFWTVRRNIWVRLTKDIRGLAETISETRDVSKQLRAIRLFRASRSQQVLRKEAIFSREFYFGWMSQYDAVFRRNMRSMSQPCFARSTPISTKATRSIPQPSRAKPRRSNAVEDLQVRNGGSSGPVSNDILNVLRAAGC